MKNKIHFIAAIVAALCVATFFISTIIVEIFGTPDSISMIKRLIVYPGLFILIPSMAIVGGTGFALSKNKQVRLIKNKQKRMLLIAANGILVLVPCAIYLNI